MATALAFIGPAVSAVGSLQAGMAAQQAANYQAQVAKNNAKVAEYNAARATVRGGIENQLKDSEFAQLIGQQTVEQAASGVAVSGRSQLRARNATRMYALGDRMAISENTGMENYNYRVEATNFKAEAAAAKAQGKAAMVGGVLGAAGAVAGMPFDKLGGKSLIGSAASAARIPIPRPRPPGHRGVIPVPRPKPRMPSIGANPLLRSRYNFGH